MKCWNIHVENTFNYNKDCSLTYAFVFVLLQGLITEFGFSPNTYKEVRSGLKNIFIFFYSTYVDKWYKSYNIPYVS